MSYYLPLIQQLIVRTRLVELLMTKNIQMVDLISQYQDIKSEVDAAMQEVVASAQFIKGPKVAAFEANLGTYLGAKHVIGCANGTDALQIALMALDLQPGDEVIVPSFTYVATAEVIALLGLKPIMIDVELDSFNINVDLVAAAITEKTKAIIPVHLFGQSTDMQPIMDLAKALKIPVIEDNAQAIGAVYNGQQKAGTIGDIGCTSFFPSKNLGCYGDGGAIFTNSDELDAKIRMIANHGQSRRYYHDSIGVNSRLDALQAVVLDIKLKRLDQYNAARQKAAAYYDAAFKNIATLQTPIQAKHSTHVFHQYTLRIKNGQRDALQTFLKERGIPTGIYYPVPLYRQKAYQHYFDQSQALPNTELLCQEVLSLPMHSELNADVLEYIAGSVLDFFEK